MKIVIAMDSFKGSVSAQCAGEALERGMRRGAHTLEIVKLPVTDGGEGLLEVLHMAKGGEFHSLEVHGPQGKPVQAKYLRLPDHTAVIESAQACGLTLLEESERDPLGTSTYGVGELIRKALDDGCRKILIGLGGSATNDGGAGLAQALGVQLLDAQGRQLPPGGGALSHLKEIRCEKLDPRLKECSIQAACDVTNVLSGPNGAAVVYGPQKGATPEQVEQLDQALGHYGSLILETLGLDMEACPGSGAAGGLGSGLLAFCGAELRSGIDIILDAVSFEDNLAGADLVVTGEGKIDGQTTQGKVVAGVARRAKAAGDIPVVAVVGNIGDDVREIFSQGIDAIVPISTGPMTLEESIQRAEELLEESGERLIRLLNIGKKMGKQTNIC